VQPREDVPAPKPPPRAEASDKDRQARTREQAPKPANEMPVSRGNTSERVEATPEELARGGRGPEPDPAIGQQARAEPQPESQPQPQRPEALKLPDAPGLRLPSNRPPSKLGGGGSLGDAIRNLQRYVETDQFNNQQGTGSFGPAIQFDT
jgi:hypothetical protein